MENAPMENAPMENAPAITLMERISSIYDLVQRANVELISIAHPPGFQIEEDRMKHEPPDVLGRIEDQLDNVERQATALYEFIIHLKVRLSR